MNDQQIFAVVARKMRRKTSILTDAEVAVAAAVVREMLRASFGDHFSVYLSDRRSEDIIRWSSLTARCEQERDRQGLSIRDAALRLGIPQYRLRAIEKGRVGEFTPEMARRYFDHLRIKAWLRRWTSANREVAERAGLLSKPRAPGAGNIRRQTSTLTTRSSRRRSVNTGRVARRKA